MPAKILCTGGAGYIGSHTVLKLIEDGHDVHILDNLCNSSPKVVPRLEQISGRKIPFHKIDAGDSVELNKLFSAHKFDGVVHFAAFKAVGDSVEMPLEYYKNNVLATIALLEVMRQHDCKRLVYSSSCTVYAPSETPVDEDSVLGPTNPYGHSKLMCEQVIRDMCAADKGWKVSILRYFNPVGAHPDGLIGESPKRPTNILPIIQEVSVGRRTEVSVFGNDWPTRDGTGVRDYIHVCDLAEGHVAALRKLFAAAEGCCLIHNLGTNSGSSVLEIVKLFEEACGKPIPFKMAPRRHGDVASVVSVSNRAAKDLGWTPKLTMKDVCASAWKWQSNNPFGFDGKEGA
eukprot:Selendium_serpulae@DN5543_c0_g2_i2.p1